jgi:hypothetical protein
VAAAGDLTWQEMAQRPELWPAQCTSKATIPFDGGVTVNAGQKLKVLKVLPNSVQVSTLDDKVTFEAEPDETDALAVARAAYAMLTPKQRALTYAAVVPRKDLWPARVTATRSFNLAPGKIVQAGDALTVVDCQPGGLTVKSEKFNATFNVVADATDIVPLARQLVEDPKAVPTYAAVASTTVAANAPSQDRVLGELEGKLVNSVTDKPDPLDPKALPRYLVFMRGSSTCPITRKFAPTLVKYYNDMKPKHPEFEIIWIMTESPEDTGRYAKTMGFSWRAIEYESTGTMPSVSQPITGKLPQLIVMDRNGKVLANGSQNQAPAALARLDALLKQPPTQ